MTRKVRDKEEGVPLKFKCVYSEREKDRLASPLIFGVSELLPPKTDCLVSVASPLIFGVSELLTDPVFKLFLGCVSPHFRGK